MAILLAIAAIITIVSVVLFFILPRNTAPYAWAGFAAGVLMFLIVGAIGVHNGAFKQVGIEGTTNEKE